MIIYGVALLSFCFLLGKVMGAALGYALGIDGDVGGVGFAMLLLMFTNLFMKRKGFLQPKTKDGILFWSSMYLPIIVAMAATQNVHAALSGGFVAIAAGGLVTILAFFLVPLIAKVGKPLK